MAGMSPNKKLVETYLDGFRTNDHEKILWISE
jgi:hypothetical protein